MRNNNIVKLGTEMQNLVSPYRLTITTELMLVTMSIACMSFPLAALISNPRLLSKNPLVGGAFSTPALLHRASTNLKMTHENDAEDDFSSFNDFGEEEDGHELAREFYQELQNRQPSPEFKPVDETYAPGDDRRKSKGRSKITIRADSKIANIDRSTAPSPSPSRDSSPLLQLFSFLSPPSRPPTSAGLFSGSGTTVVSSGRSIRAEIEILETTIKNNDTADSSQGWDGFYVGSPEQTEEAFRLVAISFIVLSTVYVAMEASGGTAVISWDEAAASFNDAMGLMTDVTTDRMPDIMVNVGTGDMFLGEGSVLLKESADWVASVGDAVRSVEELVLC